MRSRLRYPVLGLLLALVAGAFLWRYAGTTGPVDKASPRGQQILTGWRPVDDVALPARGRTLPGIAGAAAGVPRRGTVLVNLWFSSCGPCRKEMPWLQRFSEEGPVGVVGVTRDAFERYAESLMRRTGVTYPNVWDRLGYFWDSLGRIVPARAAPSTLLVVDGRVTWAHVGPFRSYADLRDSVTKRL